MAWKLQGNADVGVSELNLQHQRIFDLFFELQEAVINNRAEEKLFAIFDGLVEYTEYHFATEEKYFKQYDYPLAEEHIEEHRELKKMTLELRANLQANELKSALLLLKFMEKWINNHVIGTDKKFSKFFNDHGLF